jgi:DNA-binding GntR family transcriptional regulator
MSEGKLDRRQWPAARPRALRPGQRTGIVSKEPIHEQILPYIRQDIVSNRWKPGERLPEPQLCEEFGVSRTPLRDVLKILEAEGLVHLKPHVGAVVTMLDAPDLAEKLEVLTALEQMAAMKVARTQPPDTIGEIRRLHAAMDNAARQRQAVRYYRLNDRFHRAIVLGAKNPTLARQHELVMWHIHRARLRANEHERFSETAAEHHEAIVRHIVQGEPEAAARAMREHLEDVARIVLSK